MQKYKVMREYKDIFKKNLKKMQKTGIKNYIFFVLNIMLFGVNLFSKNIEKVDNSTKVVETSRERSIEKMNFFIPVNEQNRFSTYGEADTRQDKNIYKYTFGDGYIRLTKNWDFNYRIMREFQRYKTTESENPDSNSWDNEISFSRKNKDFKIGNRVFGSNFAVGIKHAENSTRVTENSRDYKFYAEQKISIFFPSLGKGGTYTEYGLSLNGVNGSIRNGYSILGSIGTSTTLGYGFQWSNSLENEYMDYNNYNGDLRTKYETVFRWTYELGKHFAISPEATFKVEKYFKHDVDNLSIESSFGPYLLYSQNFTNKVRVYGKAGPVFRYEKTKYGNYNYKKSQLTGYAKLGLEYIF